MKQSNQQNRISDEGTNQKPEVTLTNYLVTESVNPNNLGEEKLKSDLSLLSEAEDKKEYKADITKGIENPKVKRAVSSLKLSNPFKGY
jgi:hypothetical protein